MVLQGNVEIFLEEQIKQETRTSGQTSYYIQLQHNMYCSGDFQSDQSMAQELSIISALLDETILSGGGGRRLLQLHDNMSHVCQRATSTLSCAGQITTGSGVKASSTQHQSKSPSFCCSPNPLQMDLFSSGPKVKWVIFSPHISPFPAALNSSWDEAQIQCTHCSFYSISLGVANNPGSSAVASAAAFYCCFSIWKWRFERLGLIFVRGSESDNWSQCDKLLEQHNKNGIKWSRKSWKVGYQDLQALSSSGKQQLSWWVLSLSVYQQDYQSSRGQQRHGIWAIKYFCIRCLHTSSSLQFFLTSM